MHLIPKLKQPAEKRFGSFRLDLYCDVEMLIILRIRIKGHVLAETVNDGVCKGAVEFQLYRFRLSAEHGEGGTEIFRKVKILVRQLALFL